MPVNKDALLRYLSIHKRLKKSSATLLELSGASNANLARFATAGHNISSETIKKDIKHLRDEFDAPIIFDSKKQKYKYSNNDYQFLSVPDSLLERLLNSIQLNYLFKNATELKNAIQFETSTTNTNLEIIPIIAKSIIQKRLIQFQYKSVNRLELKTHSIKALLIKENRNSWYVLGMPTEIDSIRTFRIDRIIGEPIILEEKSKILSDFDGETYFKNSIGITAQYDEPTDIILSFNPNQTLYLLEQPLYYTQEILIIDNIEFRIKIYVEPTYELLANILSYGNSVKIISPVSLVAKTKSLLEQTLKQYE